MKKLHLLVTAALLLAIFLVPIYMYAAHTGDVQVLEMERRKTGPFPAWPDRLTSNRLAVYFTAVDRYISDHMPFRDFFISTIAGTFESLNYEFAPMRGYKGKDGWLFLGNYLGNELSKLVFSRPLKEYQRRRLVASYRKIVETANRYGTKVCLLIGPNKSSVYPEHLPPYFSPAENRYLDHIVAALGEIDGLLIYDPTERLRKIKTTGGLLYIRTDTHWNALGGIRTFEGLLEFLHLPPLPPFHLEQTDPVRGDLIGLSGHYHFPVSGGDNFTLVWETPLELTPPISQQATFNTRSHTTNPNATTNLTAWTATDSFGNMLKEGFFATFSEVTHLSSWQRALPKLPKLLEEAEQKPDYVFLVVVEKYF